MINPVTDTSRNQAMYKLLLLILLASVPRWAIGQVEPPFHTLMNIAKIKKVIPVDTVAGRTNVLFTSIADNPDLIFIYAPGGDGHMAISTGENGLPLSKRPRNPAYFFAPAFLEKSAAWAAIDVPAMFASTTDVMASRALRTDQKHIDAMTQVGRKFREEFPKARLILLGHSNGAVAAGMQAILTKPPFDGIVFSAPQLAPLPFSWKPEQANVPIMFITHENDACKGSEAYQTVRAAGSKFPVTVIKSPSSGSPSECFMAPGPHFFTDTHVEYADVLLKWAASLK